MQKQTHSKAAKAKVKATVRGAAKKKPARKRRPSETIQTTSKDPGEPVTRRSPWHWHTPDELIRLEEQAQQHAAHDRRDANDIGFARARGDGSFEVRDDVAELLTEEFLVSAVRGEETHRILDDEGDEEALGPVIETTAAKIFAGGTDDMNSEDAEREALPTVGKWEIPQEPRKPS